MNISSKLVLTAANASANRSRVVLSMRVMASPVDAMASIRSLRCVGEEGVALLEFVELLDGHHVDGAERRNPRLQAGDRLLRAEHRRAPRRRLGVRGGIPGSPTRHPRRPLRRLRHARRPRPRPHSASLLVGEHLRHRRCDFLETLVERLTAGLREVAEVRFGRRPRDFERGRERSDIVETTAGLARAASCSPNAPWTSTTCSSASRHAASGHRARRGHRRWPPEGRRWNPRVCAAHNRCVGLGLTRGDPLPQIGGGILEAPNILGNAEARSTSAACVARDSAARRPIEAWRSRPSSRRRCASASSSESDCCSTSRSSIDRRASASRDSRVPRSSLARRRSLSISSIRRSRDRVRRRHD